MRFALAAALLLLAGTAAAQSVPQGQPVLNQGYELRAVTPSDTATILVTRALYIGNSSACNIAVVGNGDSTAVTLSNVQPGEILPLQVTKVMSTNTTCTGTVAIY